MKYVQKQNPRVPAREPGYFSLNAKKSNQKKLCAARGISCAMFPRGQDTIARETSAVSSSAEIGPLDSAPRHHCRWLLTTALL
jgi:hypothetical protein